MSTHLVDKPTSVVLCDYCEQEINTEDKRNWAHIIREWISNPTQSARYLCFSWHRSAPTKIVTYDFHASCFDQMMRKLKGDTHAR